MSPSLEENKALIREFWEESDRRNGLAVDLFAPGFIAHVPGAPPLDPEGFEDYGKPFFAGFSRWNSTLEDMVAENDKVAFRVRIQTTHTAEFMGIPASGKEVLFQTIGIARLSGGKIAEWWNSPDRMGFMEQIGTTRT